MPTPRRGLCCQLQRGFSVLQHNKRKITLDGLGPKPVNFINVFLRDACQSDDSIDGQTKQKRFGTASILNSSEPEKVNVSQRGLDIVWSDGHQSSFSEDWLRRYSSPLNSLSHRRLLGEWQSWRQHDIYQVPYQKIMDKGSGEYNKAVQELLRSGIMQVTDMPDGQGEPPYVEKLTTLLATYPRHTFYGTSWDVKSTPNAKNVAYTSVYLPLHMDLLYYESPPGLQLLHVVENNASGGNSIFVDAYAAAVSVRDRDLEAYRALCRVPLSYQYVNDGQHYFQMRPVIVENRYAPKDASGFAEIESLNYSPPFQAPIDYLATTEGISHQEEEAFQRGLCHFEEFIQDSQNQVEFRMPPNTCIVFFNRRILHARREFDGSSGTRLFKGAYADVDAFYSTIRNAK